jgi:ABC-2 type transport system permease protein
VTSQGWGRSAGAPVRAGPERHVAGSYLTAFAVAAGRVLRRPGELAVRLLFYTVILVVFAALWSAAAAAVGGRVAGYSSAALLWYVTVAEAAVIATKPRLIEDIGIDIGTGTIATEMLRPVSVLWLRLASELGEAAVRLAMALPIGTAFTWIVAGAPPARAAALLALPSAVLAVAANLAAQHAFAGAAFWLSDAKATWYLYQKLVFLLGGMLLPLQLFPAWLERVAWVLPFWTMAYAPARLTAGSPPQPWLLAAQAAWLVGLAGAAAVVFAAGERHLELAGG